jgi:uncharacterized membrane protein YqjE
MDENDTDSWRASLKRASDTLLGLAQNRLELFALELQEEKIRILSLFTWLAVALAIVVTGLLIGLITLAVYCWSVSGYFGLAGLALALLSIGSAMLWAVHAQLQRKPPPFAATIGEFSKDRNCLRHDA